MKRIVVGVDGSEESRLALRWAADEAKLRGAALRVVHAWPSPYAILAGLNVQMGERFDGDVIENERRIADDLVEKALIKTGVEASGLSIEREVSQGPAVATLLEAAQEADLLVVGTRGLGGFTGLVLGSVSQQCAQHASCPVVIVHTGEH